MTLPTEIDPNPIIEAVFQIKFSPIIPEEAIFGIIYNEFKDNFKTVNRLPILQLPQVVRSQDPKLKFAPHYRLPRENEIIHIGPSIFSYSIVNNYNGWKFFSKKIIDIYNVLRDLNVFEKVDSVSLRYINLFKDYNIFKAPNLDILIGGRSFSEYKNDFISNIPSDFGVTNLKLLSGATANLNNNNYKGSIIDIDTYADLIHFSEFEDAIEYVHHQAKEIFFDIVKGEFLDKFNPKYEDGKK